MSSNSSTKTNSLRGFHRASALIIGVYLPLHIANHMYGLTGQQNHISFMAAIRPLYRNAFVEPVLLALVLWQAGSGLTMVWRALHYQRNHLAWLQHMSGLYMAMFLGVHVSAVLFGRHALGLDTDFRFAAAGFHVEPFNWFFAPYYFLAVFCLFAHVGCAAYWLLDSLSDTVRRTFVVGFCIVGLVCASLIVFSLAGVLYSVDIPQTYRATYGS